MKTISIVISLLLLSACGKSEGDTSVIFYNLVDSTCKVPKASLVLKGGEFPDGKSVWFSMSQESPVFLCTYNIEGQMFGDGTTLSLTEVRNYSETCGTNPLYRNRIQYELDGTSLILKTDKCEMIFEEHPIE